MFLQQKKRKKGKKNPTTKTPYLVQWRCCILILFICVKGRELTLKDYYLTRSSWDCVTQRRGARGGGGRSPRGTGCCHSLFLPRCPSSVVPSFLSLSTTVVIFKTEIYFSKMWHEKYFQSGAFRVIWLYLYFCRWVRKRVFHAWILSLCLFILSLKFPEICHFVGNSSVLFYYCGRRFLTTSVYGLFMC